jgi:hypothetical protein
MYPEISQRFVLAREWEGALNQANEMIEDI